MRKSRIAAIVVAVTSCLPLSSFAASFIVPSDADLVRSAPVIVVGTAGQSESFEQAGEIYTRTSLSIHESIRGPVSPGQTIGVVGMGGVLDDRFEIVSGVPRFMQGERVLLFLTLNDFGQWAVQSLSLGKFTFVDWDGERYLIRGVGSEHVFGWTPDGGDHSEPLRAAAPFLAFIRSAADDETTAKNRDYIRTLSSRGARITADLILEATAEPNAYLSTVNFNGQDIGFRWREFDSGGGVVFDRDGAQPGFDASSTAASIERAMAAWNNHAGSDVSYQLGGTTNGGFVMGDGTNAVVFNKTFPTEAGGAIGFAKWQGGVVYTHNGSTFIATTEGDVIIRNTLAGETLLDEVLCHELGHTLGFRHSDQGTPSSNDAVMRSVASGARGANLGSWDIEAMDAVYGEGGSTCTPPSITSHPQSTTINSGASANLSASATGTAPLSYQWARRPAGSGASFTNVSGGTSATLNTGALTESTEFRVTVTNACGNATSNTATVTVQDCDEPAFTGQPQSETIQSGQSTTLSVSVSGTSPISLQWYRRTGTSGSFSPLSGATTSSLNTGALTQTMQYFVRATNACGTSESTIATITVEVVCQPPSITSQPVDRTLPLGGGQVTLTVGASGTSPLTIRWFRSSVSGSTQIGTGSSLTVDEAGNYFATVSNDCGSVDSRIATVTAQQCDAITILQQPQSQQITSGTSATLAVDHSGTGPFTYQWYRGNRSDVSNPVAGATARTFTTPALTANATYWVRITNCAGSVDSQAATITVAAACTEPNITQQPQGTTITSGQTATLTVTATGTSLQYQWFRGQRGDTSNPIAGATSRTFTTPSLTGTTSYWVRVSNGCGTKLSNAATITVGSSRRRGAKPPRF